MDGEGERARKREVKRERGAADGERQGDKVERGRERLTLLMASCRGSEASGGRRAGILEGYSKCRRRIKRSDDGISSSDKDGRKKSDKSCYHNVWDGTAITCICREASWRVKNPRGNYAL